MAYRREVGRFLELNVVDWLILFGGVGLIAMATLLFLIHWPSTLNGTP
jgi:hypothetical protein